jgi:hypothetical protein
LHAAREIGALYEIALTLRARAIVRHDEADAAEAQRLLDMLGVVRLPEIPIT